MVGDDQPGAGPWLPEAFEPPARVELACGMHLRPIRGSDVEIDYPAVMGSRERLWAKYGEAWGWPPATMTLEQDRRDLEHHEREIAARETFNYAILDADESALYGCIYIDPAGMAAGQDAPGGDPGQDAPDGGPGQDAPGGDPGQDAPDGGPGQDAAGGDPGHDVIVSWWVVDGQLGGTLEAELTRFVPRWVTRDWPFTRPLYAP